MKFFKFLPILFCLALQAQEEVVHSVYFEFDKFTLNEKEVNEAIDFIKKTDSTRIEDIQIFGYTDDVGKDDYNLNLSQNRAEAVKNFLLENGISNSITAKGLGESNPKYDNTNGSVKAKNRRVDIYFITYN